MLRLVASDPSFDDQATWRWLPSQYGARSAYFWTFPVAVRGIATRNSTDVGALYPAIRSLQCAMISASVAHAPSASTTSALTVSPHLSSGTPMTATSATAGWRKMNVLDLDRGDVLGAGDDHVLLPVRDREMALAVEPAAVAGVEPATLQGLGTGVRVVPVTREDDVGAGEDLAGVGGREPDAQRGRARAAQLRGALDGRQGVVGRPGAVERQQRRGLGQAVDLQELPAQLLAHPLDRARGGWGARADDAHPAPAGDLAVPVAELKR